MPALTDHNSRPLFSRSSLRCNPELFEQWVPKINSYRKALKDSLPTEYLAPAQLLPDDLDSNPFNATLIPPKVMDTQSLEITSLPAHEIATKISKGELTAVQTLQAFVKRATLAHQLTNCAMELLFEEGLQRARELDLYQSVNGTTCGPLHGVPISLKEHFDYPNHITHRGYVSLLDRIPNKFATSCQILYDLGAVFYIRTTEPQSLMHPDSWNNITGRGRNALKTTLSPGGSSSGEGSLIAMRGSPLGLGSDIGGSVRFPAAFNGIWSLKPSTKRISKAGCGGAADGFYSDGVVGVLGPMAHNAQDLEFFMKSYLSSEPWLLDQQLVPLPWRSVPAIDPGNTTIAIYYDDGVVKPHPPIVRALEEVRKKLKKAGFNVITWDAHRVYEAMEVTNALYTQDGNVLCGEKLQASGEPLFPLMDAYLSVGHGDQGLTVLESMEYSNIRETLRQEYLELMNSKGIDFILGPTYVGVAPKPSTTKYWSYTSLWNLLDYSCVTFPSGIIADQNIDLKDANYAPRNEYEEYEYGLYDPVHSDGMPVGLSLIGRRYTEEATLVTSMALFDALK